VKLFHTRPLHFLAKKDRITASLGFSAYPKRLKKELVYGALARKNAFIMAWKKRKNMLQ